MSEITAPELLEVIRVAERRGALDVAGRLSQRCGAIFRYAIQTGRASYNPAADLRGAIKSRKVTHRPALGRAELPEFLAKLEAYDGHTVTRCALRLALLTFVRTNELRGARWHEFDTDAALWRIPAERMKMQTAHLVPVAEQTLEVLEELRPLTRGNVLLFPGERNPLRPMSENTMLYALYRMGYHSRATVHGLRATASTILNESGFAPDIIERQLAHVERNKIRAAYHRAEYLDDRRRMMQWWADYLSGLSTGVPVDYDQDLPPSTFSV